MQQSILQSLKVSGRRCSDEKVKHGLGNLDCNSNSPSAHRQTIAVAGRDNLRNWTWPEMVVIQKFEDIVSDFPS